MSEETDISLQSVFACQATSVEEIEKAMFENVSNHSSSSSHLSSGCTELSLETSR